MIMRITYSSAAAVICLDKMERNNCVALPEEYAKPCGEYFANYVFNKCASFGSLCV